MIFLFYEFYSKKKTWKITRYKICFRKETFRTRVNARTHSVWKIINSNVPFVLSLFRRSRINKHSRVRVSHTYSPSPLLQDKHSPFVLRTLVSIHNDFELRSSRSFTQFSARIENRYPESNFARFLCGVASNVLIRPNGSIERCIPFLGTTLEMDLGGICSSDNGKS